MQAITPGLEALIEDKKVIVCVGSGGVGKTTTSAVIALQAALVGKRALVLTIDPAKRLANSLGVSELGNSPIQIPIERFKDVGLEPKGELWAMMLDMKTSFDDIVMDHAPNEAAARNILDNKLYHYFSSSLAGTQEYAAAERLYELHKDGEYDLIVLDTPPTTHALDFLEAPTRLIEAINSKALSWLHKPGAARGFGLMKMGSSYMLKTLGKFTGGEMLSELGTFLKAFSILFDGFQERASGVRELLTSEYTTFCVITAPNAGNIDEAIYFYDKLDAQTARVGAFVANRVHPSWVPKEDLNMPTIEILKQIKGISPAFDAFNGARKRDIIARLKENAREFQILAYLDAEAIERLRDHVHNTVPVMKVPYFSRDIHSLEGLNHVRTSIFGEA
jgi:anion-transporting  ArsA/GET3 family ATPase